MVEHIEPVKSVRFRTRIKHSSHSRYFLIKSKHRKALGAKAGDVVSVNTVIVKKLPKISDTDFINEIRKGVLG